MKCNLYFQKLAEVSQKIYSSRILLNIIYFLIIILLTMIISGDISIKTSNFLDGWIQISNKEDSSLNILRSLGWDVEIIPFKIENNE